MAQPDNNASIMQADVPHKNGSRYRQHCKCNAYKIKEINFPLSLTAPRLLSPPIPITGGVEFVLFRRTSLPVTPGLILMLNYFSFANDVAQLQSARLNMDGDREEGTGFMEMWIHRSLSLSHSLFHY